MSDMDTCLADIAEQNAVWRGDQMALAQGATQLTWREAWDRMVRVGDLLTERGVLPGERLALLARNSIDYVVLQYALARMGAVLVPINHRLHANEVESILDDSEPVLVLFEGSLADNVPASYLSGDRSAVTAELVPVDGADGLWDWEAAPKVGPLLSGEPEPAGLDWDRPMAILYTGGTTGRPKGVVISHRRNVVDGLSAALAFGLRPGERFLCMAPLSHTAAWDYIKSYFLVGGSVVVMEAFDGTIAVDMINTYRCNGLWAVPLMLREMIQAPNFEAADVSSMRLIAYSAYDPSDLLLEVVQRFRDRGASNLSVAHGYGLTEAGPFVTILRPEDALDDPMSVGTPVPGVLVTLLDDAGVAVAHGEVGEICLRSSALMSGYWRNEQSTREAFAGGWLHTGDLGRINGRGHLTIEGRSKDMIRTAGENVYAKEVENALVEHPGVVDSAVIGRADDVYGERIVAIVVAQSARRPEITELQSFVRDRIAGFKVPRDIVFVDALPKTTAGKTNKLELRQQYGDP